MLSSLAPAASALSSQRSKSKQTKFSYHYQRRALKRKVETILTKKSSEYIKKLKGSKTLPNSEKENEAST